ncbi:sce7725 family protein [Stagnimonas aquatica]|uniref:sce7725 family protein n=1 Tax=Stagnimonas aquatica TaxID=2689987 RepID=UPI0011CDC0C5|nr:sce7725 family protein [Stagnimonas aquatica]
MYVPVLHARQSERSAVLRVSPLIKASDLCKPFFQPVTNKQRDVELLVRQASEAELPCFLLTTPLYDSAPSQRQILAAINAFDENDCMTPVVAITSELDVATFERRIAAVGRKEFAVFHDSEPGAPNPFRDALARAPGLLVWHLFRGDTCSDRYMRQWPGPKATISDHFNRRPRNQDYAADTDELYAARLRVPGFDAFGDYTITGDFYAAGGGRPGAVAIHLSYERPDGTVGMRHFLSDSHDRADDVRDKFQEALAYLIDFLARQRGRLDFSSACDELKVLQQRSHFPGLPALKRISIQHHIELMIQLARRP